MRVSMCVCGGGGVGGECIKDKKVNFEHGMTVETAEKHYLLTEDEKSCQ